MSLSSYTGFIDVLKSWADNSDLDSRVDDCIELAHARLNRALRIDAMETLEEGDTVGGERWLTKPDDYLGMRRLKITLGTGRVLGLDYITPAEMDDTPAYNTNGQPGVFTLVGNRIRLGPIPSEVYKVEMTYYHKVATLTSSNTTNVFLTEVPDLLLYASLIEAGIWMRDPEMRDYWAGEYTSRLQEVQANDELGQFPAGQLAARAV